MRAIPRSVWALGFTSMFMDVSSEMIHSLLPVFLVTSLGASMSVVGLIEGIGEATASISKLFSGWLSDRFGNRKGLTVIGYGLGAMSKPLFAFAPTVGWVVAARFSDRLGKGIRGAPRDALVGDLVIPELRGAAYGLRQSLDTVGAFGGPLIALAVMALSRGDIRLVFWLAVLPGLAAVVILIVGVREPTQRAQSATRPFPLSAHELLRLPLTFWGVTSLAAILTLARIGEAFLVLRAAERGLPIALVPIVLVVMNVVYAVTAYPMGRLADRIDRRLILAVGFAVLAAADVVLGVAGQTPIVMLGVALWGLHMGMTQGILAALVADSCPADARGTAFGLFNVVVGLALLMAGVGAGVLWQAAGAPATFLSGAGVAFAGLVASAAFASRRR